MDMDKYGKIYKFEEMEEFYGSDEWKLEINVADLWNSFQKGEKTPEQFNTEYRNRMIEYQNSITQLGQDIWTELSPILEKMTTTKNNDEYESTYEQIYDWADKNEVLIKTK